MQEFSESQIILQENLSLKCQLEWEVAQVPWQCYNVIYCSARMTNGCSLLDLVALVLPECNLSLACNSTRLELKPTRKRCFAYFMDIVNETPCRKQAVLNIAIRPPLQLCGNGNQPTNHPPKKFSTRPLIVSYLSMVLKFCVLDRTSIPLHLRGGNVGNK